MESRTGEPPTPVDRGGLVRRPPHRVANGKVFVASGFGSAGASPVVHVFGLLHR